MTTVVKIGIGVAIVATAVAVVPALKGPYNRLVNEANEKLNDEFVVDNYKAEYVKLNNKKIELSKNIEKFTVEKRIIEKKIQNSYVKVNAAKELLRTTGTTDLVAFNHAKDAYESFKLEHDNLVAMQNVYSNGIVKLTMSLALVEDNMRKAKANVDMLSSKKVLVDSIKSVNDTISDISGTGDAGIAVAVEKLDDAVLREGIKLEAMSETTSTKATMTEADAKAYLDSLK